MFLFWSSGTWHYTTKAVRRMARQIPDLQVALCIDTQHMH